MNTSCGLTLNSTTTSPGSASGCFNTKAYHLIAFVCYDLIGPVWSALQEINFKLNLLLDYLFTFAFLALLLFITEFPFSLADVAVFLHLLIHAWSNLYELHYGSLSLARLAVFNIFSPLTLTCLTQPVPLHVNLHQLTFVDLFKCHVDHHLFRFDLWLLLGLLPSVTKHHLHQSF